MKRCGIGRQYRSYADDEQRVVGATLYRHPSTERKERGGR